MIKGFMVNSKFKHAYITCDTRHRKLSSYTSVEPWPDTRCDSTRRNCFVELSCRSDHSHRIRTEMPLLSHSPSLQKIPDTTYAISNIQANNRLKERHYIQKSSIWSPSFNEHIHAGGTLYITCTVLRASIVYHTYCQYRGCSTNTNDRWSWQYSELFCWKTRNTFWSNIWVKVTFDGIASGDNPLNVLFIMQAM